jgi:hypothetical protein
MHYRSHVESWPGGFHRDNAQDEKILVSNPLPSTRLVLREFAVNGHRVTYDGDYTVAFRLEPAGKLIGFAGHNCREITLNGHTWAFADRPLALAAWAPVAPERQVPGGAILELWFSGPAKVALPLPPGVARGELFFEGAQPGVLGEQVASEVADGLLRFEAGAWNNRRLYFVG